MRRIRAFGSAALMLSVASCAPTDTTDTPRAPAATTDKIGVVEVSNYPLEYVVTRLASPLLEIRFRAADAPDPAYWKPTPEDVLAMQDADLIVVNGASYESWMKDVSLPPSRIVDTTSASADRLVAIAGMLTHSHGTEGAHQHSGAAFTTWLDPTLLQAQAEAAEKALSTRWPNHAGLFSERLADLRIDLETLDAELAAATKAFQGMRVVFSHPVYQYLQARYGVEGPSVHLEPDVAPDESQLADLERIVAHDRVKCMIWEDEPAPETVERLQTLGVTSIVFQPLGSRPANGDYFDVMRRNVEALQAGSNP